MARRLSSFLLLLFIVSCVGNPPPNKPWPCTGYCPDYHSCNETTNQCEPINNCHLDYPWCSHVGQTCSSAESPCKHNPSSDPFYCEEAPKCPPEPQCTESLTCDCYVGEVFVDCPDPDNCPKEPDLVAAGEPAPQFHAEIYRATQILGDLCGGNPRSNLDKLAIQLRKQLPNRCIISGIEAIFIARDDGLYEENHAVAFGSGCWTNSGRGKYMGSHRDNSPIASCHPPYPNLDKMKFKIEAKGNHVDTTYVTIGQPDYCASINFCCMPGTGTPENTCDSPGCIPRGGCPIRQEGDPERFPCERVFIGKQTATCNGNPLPNYNNNPAQFLPCNGRFKTCTEDGRTCSEVEL